MKTIDLSLPVLFHLHNTKLYTNNTAGPREMYHANTLGFSLINASEEAILFAGAQQSLILLTFHTGSGSESLFSPSTPEADFGTIYGPDPFLPSTATRNPVKPDQIRMLIAIKDTASFRLDPGQSLSFTWNPLIIDTPEGFCTLSLSFAGVDGTEGLLLSQSLYKERIGAHIINFFASPSGGAPAGKCTLHWQTENTDTGMILPMEYSIFNESGAYTSSYDITLLENTHCYLNISAPYGNTYEDVYIQLIPPVIAAAQISGRQDAGRFAWEVHFASRVALMTDRSYTAVDSTGSVALSPDTACVALRCSGLYTLERRITLSPLADISCFNLDIWTFPSHQCLILTWQAAASTAVTISAWDQAYYTVSTDTSGVYEQIYPADLPVTFRLSYECASGKGNLLLSNQANL